MSLERDVILLLGGQDKDLDFSELLPIINEKCRAVIPFGAARNKIANQLNLECYDLKNLSDAVKFARKIAQKGDTILLSPGCTSFDEFNSFEQRGDKFRELVLNANQ
jgi:UDP-N-acetylmuramoylalanine--D-glutamate ligase